ncbi:DUF3179 domain-containing protein [bacterium AH-315-P15]|nr:DUF3179 domain-containing protein [bacterium AH-315-P15]
MAALRFLAGFAVVAFVVAFLAASADAQDAAAPFRAAWPDTDFTQVSVDLGEVMSGGPPRDGIPPIDAPRFEPVGSSDLEDASPVLSVEIDGDARAYPLSILMWHEIVNDVISGEPVVVAYCPLCNSGAAYFRTIDGTVYDFGTSGLLRHSDLVMYDRQTDSWWQQFTGNAIAGVMNETELTWIPIRMEAIGRFRARHPEGQVLVPNDEDLRSYGQNPYVGYDSSNWPFMFRGEFDEDISPLARVIAVDDQAWSLDYVRQAGRIEAGDLVITWAAGQNSALDASDIADGEDIGNVVVQRRVEEGLEDAVYMIPFAFAFKAFHPDGTIYTASN